MRWREWRGLSEEHWPASARDDTPVNKFQGGQVDVQGCAAAGLTLAASEKYSRTNIPCRPSLTVFCLHADGRLAAQIPAHNRETRKQHLLGHGRRPGLAGYARRWARQADAPVTCGVGAAYDVC